MKRVTLFVGHYGSGKSNIAVNYALFLKRKGHGAALADIDVVNPYFRSADSKAELEKEGIRVIALPFANTNVDLPALPSEVYGLVERRDVCAVLDVGGDDRGALALGRFVPYILEENDYEMLFVANFYRPLTRTAEEALEVMREIEDAAGMRCTGIVNNSNLGAETTAREVEATANAAEELANLSGLPVVFTSFDAKLSPAPEVHDPFPLTLQKKII
jgi:hypothetical protein